MRQGGIISPDLVRYLSNMGTRLQWLAGTGCDFFVSLFVLHHPREFGLRPSWAAGVRSRLPAAERETLEISMAAVRFPLAWLITGERWTSASAVLDALAAIPPVERMPLLARASNLPDDLLKALVSAPQEVEAVSRTSAHGISKKDIHRLSFIWDDLQAFGERYLQALQVYFQAFFADEEERIRPAVKAASRFDVEQVSLTDLNALVESLSRGVRFEGADFVHLTMLPSYWITPLVILRRLDAQRGVFVFGARPEDQSLVPGEIVPEGLLRVLKTLADPTRLRILRYLAHETMTPAELARRLRLRAPTVTHHLDALRLAGLVTLTLKEGKRKFYTARPEALEAAFKGLNDFLTL